MGQVIHLSECIDAFMADAEIVIRQRARARSVDSIARDILWMTVGERSEALAMARQVLARLEDVPPEVVANIREQSALCPF
jgi:hypothetical protein